MNLVTINEVKNAVTCSSDGSAEHVFNIKNTSNSSLKIDCQILTNAPTQEDWLNIVNLPSQKLEPSTITQISVQITVPEDCASDNYSYRLRIFDTKKPGERFSESHAVYFKVPDKNAPKSEEDKKCKWCIPAAIAATLMISITLTAWFLIPAKILVPDLTNMSFNKAIMAISKNQLGFDEKNNFKTIVSENNINKVVKQDPPANVEIEKGAFITIWIGQNRKLTKLELQLTEQTKALSLALKQEKDKNKTLQKKYQSDVTRAKKQVLKNADITRTKALANLTVSLKIQNKRELAKQKSVYQKQQKQALSNLQSIYKTHKNKISTVVSKYEQQQQKLQRTIRSMKGLNKFITRLSKDATKRRNKTKTMIINSLTRAKMKTNTIVSIYNNRAIYFRSFLGQLRSLTEFNNKRISEIVVASTNQQKIVKELRLTLAQSR